ncbi:MAG: phosphoesterase [Armatimonadetes bacterium]|nr:phosphoesterase [Armatimonadota bacterium]MDE2207174.1 phosphoesterase [Armatimonadota bacterium]
MKLLQPVMPALCALGVLVLSASADAPVRVNYHAAPPDAAIRPFVVAAAREPHLSAQRIWQLLRRRVKYVFVIYQENRSFDSYFGTFPGADGIYSRPSQDTPGFHQLLINTDGSVGTIQPFRMGPAQYAADQDDVTHAHTAILAKMDVVGGKPRMDRYAVTEERRITHTGNPSLKARQYGELTMAHEDCSTIPLLWRYANRFVLFDHIFQLIAGPSTPGNLAIIGAQSGETQWVLHPDEAFNAPGSNGSGVPVLGDADPFWGSKKDTSPNKMPAEGGRGSAHPQINLTYATIPLTLRGRSLKRTAAADTNAAQDLADVHHDIRAVTAANRRPVGFGWYQEGYDKRPADNGRVDAEGQHFSFVTHHDGPQYFGYIANNPRMRSEMHGMHDFAADVAHHALPAAGGVFFIKGGSQNELGLKPVQPRARRSGDFEGDDDHPGDSDSQISEAMAADTINRIAKSPYWKQCAIIITWDDSEGDYDHIPPPARTFGPDGSRMTDGPRIPLLLISPWARVHYVAHAEGDQASVVKFVDNVFQLIPLAKLPDELHARHLGKTRYGLANLGPADALTPGVTDLASAFDPARLEGIAAPLPASYVEIPESVVLGLPPGGSQPCRLAGVTPVDIRLGIPNNIPPDFNPRPSTDPTPAPN